MVSQQRYSDMCMTQKPFSTQLTEKLEEFLRQAGLLQATYNNDGQVVDLNSFEKRFDTISPNAKENIFFYNWNKQLDIQFYDMAQGIRTSNYDIPKAFPLELEDAPFGIDTIIKDLQTLKHKDLGDLTKKDFVVSESGEPENEEEYQSDDEYQLDEDEEEEEESIGSDYKSGITQKQRDEFNQKEI